MGIDFKTIPSGGTKTALPEGWYGVQVADAELRETKNGPNTMINAEFNIIEPSKYAKRKVWNNFNLGITSLWVLKSFLDASGSTLSQQGDVKEENIVQAMPGLSCDVYLEPDVTTKGDPRNKITNYRASQNNQPTQVADTSSKSNMFK